MCQSALCFLYETVTLFYNFKLRNDTFTREFDESFGTSVLTMLCVFYVIICTVCFNVANTTPALKGFEIIKDFRNAVKQRKESRNISIKFEETNEELFSRVGETVTLRCSVKNLGDNVVSWIRRKDLQILTSGAITFTSDRRIHIEHSEDEPDSWDLIVNSIQKSDTGFYECQINTDPKLKRSVLLLVYSGNGVTDYEDEKEEIAEGMTAQIANILGPAEHYVHFGSTVTFTCYVKTNDSTMFAFEPNHKRLVKWLHFSDLLTIESSRGGISIETEIYPSSIMSHLTVAAVTFKDAGLYTCKPIKGLAHNVTLIVIQNEQIEAMKPENYLQSKAINGKDMKALLFICTLITCILRVPFF